MIGRLLPVGLQYAWVPGGSYWLTLYELTTEEALGHVFGVFTKVITCRATVLQCFYTLSYENTNGNLFISLYAIVKYY